MISLQAAMLLYFLHPRHVSALISSVAKGACYPRWRRERRQRLEGLLLVPLAASGRRQEEGTLVPNEPTIWPKMPEEKELFYVMCFQCIVVLLVIERLKPGGDSPRPCVRRVRCCLCRLARGLPILQKNPSHYSNLARSPLHPFGTVITLFKQLAYRPLM